MTRCLPALLALLALLLAPARAIAEESPLERRVTLRVRDVALRDALDRIAAMARIRLSYSGDVVPLERRVSIARDSATVGELLQELLRGIGARPVIIGDDHVVLAPRALPDSTRAPPPVLEGVVVTGSVVGAPERATAMALDVVSGRASERRDESTLSSMLAAAVPGMWLYEQSPTAISARYGSIRGASSFGVSYPKVYVDGIEVANPLLLTRVEAAQVQRVEVIRGPQGAALYGADAISGVVNIVSRQDVPQGPRGSVRSRLGWVGSAFAPATPLQEHAVAYRGGDNLRSLGVAGSFASSGGYIPNAYSRDGRISADARILGAASMISVVARAQGKRAGVPINPLLPGLADDRTIADAAPQSLDLYSLGGTWRHVSSDQVTLAFTAGLDGYHLGNVSIESTPVPSSADSALRAASGGADRATIRANAVRQVGDVDRLGGTLTFIVEQSVLRDRSDPNPEAAEPDSTPVREIDVSRWSSSFGVAGQANVSFRQTLFLTAGNRFERITTIGTTSGWEALPMLGASVVRDVAGITAKLRSSYGRGVRAAAPGLPMRGSRRMHPNYLLAPEQQTGVDGGVDLYFRGVASVHATRFDQLASGLVQTVTLYDAASPGTGNELDRIHYERQNVGEITNSGWEGKATVRAGAIDLIGTFAQVDSRVRALASEYQGDLRAGDRVLGVPERTTSLTAGWARRRWSTSWTVTRAGNWTNYDRLAIAQRLQDGMANEDTVTGVSLRQFWVRYPGATRLRGTVQLDLPRGMGLTLTGENLGGEQRGEPDSMTILPGRTITATVRASF
jgi:outer membrane receptor protein involved in Fe transport